MKLTDEMIKLAIDRKEKCLFYNDDYVLLYKKMPVDDEVLEE